MVVDVVALVPSFARPLGKVQHLRIFGSLGERDRFVLGVLVLVRTADHRALENDMRPVLLQRLDDVSPTFQIVEVRSEDRLRLALHPCAL